MYIVALILAKTVSKLLRTFGRGGSALPGLIVEKVSPRFMAKMLAKLPMGVIVVTGTNGKTTTTKALTHLLEDENTRVLTNQTGSNFTRGIVAMLVNKSEWYGNLPYDIAVLELDEAFSRIFVQTVKPRYVIALNVMRDQLDRYGEIDKTADMITETCLAATEGVILNLDDNRVRKIADKVDKQIVYFAVDSSVRKHMPNEDDMYGDPEAVVQDHGLKAQATLKSYSHKESEFVVSGTTIKTSLELAGIHNSANITAALAAYTALKGDLNATYIVDKLATLRAAFGRGEVIHIGNTEMTLSLVKNPAGFSHSLASYVDDSPGSVIIAINDKYADSRDVSWLWDVDFTSLKNSKNIILTGIRGFDIANRLDYDEVKYHAVVDSIETSLLHALKAKEKSILIYCTYTAMLEIRKILSKHTKVEDVWQNKR